MVFYLFGIFQADFEPIKNEESMKAVILAGGLGTRISEETHLKPKPMIEIGGMPILWHILKIYSTYDINEFVICCGYKGYLIKEYFANYALHMSDVTIDMTLSDITFHQQKAEPWKITLVNTGEDTSTGGRLKRLKEYIENEDAFCFTYGDGLANVNIKDLIKFHHAHGKMATVTAVQPPGRYGSLGLNGDYVTNFLEKPAGDGGYINGGFFVLSPRCLEIIDGDSTPWEGRPLEYLSSQNQIMAFKHSGFWHAMDTLRDKVHLEEMWASGSAPWKVWS
jgi:glucose-1-phosphate cytidylyltransferase